jgi:hypothetical protein
MFIEYLSPFFTDCKGSGLLPARVKVGNPAHGVGLEALALREREGPAAEGRGRVRDVVDEGGGPMKGRAGVWGRLSPSPYPLPMGEGIF